MKIAVIGATGGTGIQIVERAVARGHEVTAVVRDPAKLAALTGARVEVARADARDAEAQARAFSGSDVVISAIGAPPGKDADHTILRDGIRAALAAMDAAGVRRLIAVSGSGHSTDGDGVFMRYITKPIVQAILKDTFTDMKAMEALIRASDVEWTIVRPPQLTDRPPRGRYRSRITVNPPGARITRADLADAILDALAREDTRDAVLAVAN
ncbi:NAD(P)-dependent oxidoreductase [Compostimonas suwonensis]|uniref:Putative NADH-flavin reductase n=1 Tax=Compostimonas suwonensis TaxID=1048394 RepID=A0A2M9BBB5_9MICO|nr:NAD(P)H-binding protein [Compostimonas suwonensis]PJJ55224.1 putative NADH-flavin reductase [Compostimonas suwonensis]